MLRAASHTGLFQWPRESSTEDVAASFDIALATFHQHMRVGPGKLLPRLFESRADRRYSAGGVPSVSFLVYRPVLSALPAVRPEDSARVLPGQTQVGIAA
jgi:hypothetical protein